MIRDWEMTGIDEMNKLYEKCQQEKEMKEIRYLAVKDIPKHFPFTEHQIRTHLTQRYANGLIKAVRKIGKRIYVRQDLLEEWIEKFVEISQEEIKEWKKSK